MSVSQAKHITLRQQYQQLDYFIKRQSTITTLQKKGISFFFPVQYETFDAISYGCDLIGRDRTGSGKTIAYSLPIIQRLRDQHLLDRSRAKAKFLVVVPTRQLAIQVQNEISSLKNNENQFRALAVYGGQMMNIQRSYLSGGVDILVATPGRLLDFLERGQIDLGELQSVCLDEADEMLKQGFQQDVQMILQFIGRNPNKKTQKLLFSATVPSWVEDLARNFMSKNLRYVDLVKNSENRTAKTIQHLCIRKFDNVSKLSPLIRSLIDVYAGRQGSVIIFCETKRQCNYIYDNLDLRQAKGILHGDIPQERREITFREFKNGHVRCIIATNVAARGLDIPSVDLIIQLQPPQKVDDYVHRSGRTGRAGKKGICITFFSSNDNILMRNIQKMAMIRFRTISEPRADDVLKAHSRQLIQRLRSIDPQVTEYYEQAAKDFIAQVGAEKALCFALAEINGTRKRLPEYSVQTKKEGFVSFVFSSEGEKVSQKELVQFLRERIDRFGSDDVHCANLLSETALVFDVHQKLKPKLIEVAIQCEGKDNLLDIYRLRHVIDQQTLKQIKQEEQVQFTAEEYNNALHNKSALQVILRGLDYNTEESSLFHFFKNNGIKIVQINVLRDQNGKSKGTAFALCLNGQQKQKAMSMSGVILENRNVFIEQPRPRNR